VEISEARSTSSEKLNGNRTIANLATPLSEREHQALIIEYNNSAAPYPADKTIIELFEAQVARMSADSRAQQIYPSIPYIYIFKNQ